MSPELSPRVAVYPGTFDPVTNGHIDIIRRSLQVFDRLIVAVAANIRKAPLFDAAERQAMLSDALGPLLARVELATYSGLLASYCEQRGVTTIVRGLRALADFEYEFQFAVMNRRLARQTDTMFLMTAEENFFVSSSLVKEVAGFGGDVSGLVPESVRRALERKLGHGGQAAG
jgi:pantetheine-phosphate adenylyltransferase